MRDPDKYDWAAPYRDNHPWWGVTVFIITLVLFWLFSIVTANAAKLKVSWVPPTTNNNGSPLTDLVAYRIEWGSCVGAAFGTLQSFIMVKAPASTTWIYPTGLGLVCARVFAINSAGTLSGASNVGQGAPPLVLGQPVQ